MDKKLLDKYIIKYMVFIGIFILIIANFNKIVQFGGLILNVINPLISGFIIAYILNIIITRIECKFFYKLNNNKPSKFKRAISILLSIISIVLIIMLIIYIVLPEFIKTLGIMASSFPLLIQEFNNWIKENENNVPIIAERIQQFNIDWQSIIKSVTNYITNGISNIFNSSINVVTIFASAIFNLIISISFAIYLLFSKEKLISQLKNLQKAFMKKSIAEKLNNYLSIFNSSFTNFIIGQFAEAVILGTLCVLGMWILKFPYAIAIGVFIGVTALIPMVGAYIGAFLGAFLIFMVDPIKSIWFLVFIIILQQLESNLIYPKVVGTSIGLPGIFVLVSVIIGGGLGGVVGMLLGVPIASALYAIVKSITRERLIGLEVKNNSNIERKK